MNEEIYLPQLLKSIRTQVGSGSFEVIVADNHSTDKTREIGRSFGCTIVEGGNPAEGRNAGAAAAKGKFLLFLDADVILTFGFLADAQTEFKARSLVVAGAKSIPISTKDSYVNFYKLCNWCLEKSEPIKRYGMGYCIMAAKSDIEGIEKQK